ncbi:MmcQ/YjbR family DNA-binding protein [Helicovermis profundi]|uniref:MmcQ/YjbR family DNA-binding protein n=1 Tax=Helicovermis profundi TaxID=3065157 RepID=A0AAU9EBV2_9FIRM|nr:MmcQ/YjbR family DNA-binding protein [Clostridia bacterium S502]
MTREDVVKYFLSKPYAIEYYPFDMVTAVFKVGGKMFALISDHEKDRLSINLKNTPEDNIELREMFKEIIPGYHMNKTHWNTVYLDGELEETLIKRLIDDSYNIVYKSLTKKVKKELEL